MDDVPNADISFHWMPNSKHWLIEGRLLDRSGYPYARLWERAECTVAMDHVVLSMALRRVAEELESQLALYAVLDVVQELPLGPDDQKRH